MTELKTLRDFEKWVPFYHSKDREIKLVGNPTDDIIKKLDMSELVDKKIVCGEVIKWVKALRGDFDKDKPDAALDVHFAREFGITDRKSAINILRLFFNINYGDLE